MNRRERGNFENKSKVNLTMIVSFAIVIISIVAFISAYVAYGNKLAQAPKTTKLELNNNINENEELSQVSTSFGKTVNELTNEGNQANTTQNNVAEEKMAVNTSEVEKKITQERKENTTKAETKAETTEKNVEQTKDPEFEKPVDGEVIKDYSSENLVYSNTLDEWSTHLGIDYKAEKTRIVKAASDGTIKSIKNDPRYGLTVVIEHANGFTSMYANLLSTEFVSVGEKVTKGQTIATVGNTATFEAADETHLHFEILKNGINVDPNLYIK